MAFVTHISEKHVGWMRWTLLVVFSILAMLFSLFLFWNFPSKPYLRIPYSILGFIWELGTLFFAIQLKTSFLSKRPWQGWGLMYAIFVSVSVFGGIGFNLATTGTQAKMQETVRDVSKQATSSADAMHSSLQAALDSANSDLTTYANMLKEIPPDNLNRIDQVTRWKKKAAQDVTAAALALQQYDSSRVKQVESTAVPAADKSDLDVFGALGEMLGVGGADSARKLFFIIIVIVIQAIVLMAAPVIREESADADDAKAIMRFIDALFEGNGKRLQSAHKVARTLGISPQERDRYIDMLTSMTYRGQPLLRRGPGGTITDYDKLTFKRIVTFLLENPPDSAREEDDDSAASESKETT